MAKAKSTRQENQDVEIMEVQSGHLEVCILGTSPIILNRMSEKAKRELLMPKGRKNAVEKATTLKHDPMQEFQASSYRMPHQPHLSEAQQTLLAVLATSFKGAMATAAIDLPGTKKAQIGRLTYVNGDYIPLYGVPQLSMSIVRSADMNKTPDVRTRAIVPLWACSLRVSYIVPLMRPQAVLNLLAAAGMYIGVGDWRPEKGKGNYGQFTLVGKDDERFLKIVAEGGRDAQLRGIEAPQCYDDETASLLAWFDDERGRRSLRGVA